MYFIYILFRFEDKERERRNLLYLFLYRKFHLKEILKIGYFALQILRSLAFLLHSATIYFYIYYSDLKITAENGGIYFIYSYIVYLLYSLTYSFISRLSKELISILTIAILR